MTKRERLLEEYEDSLFALIMDEFAEEEGKRLLEENERLKQDSNASIPIETNKRCLRTITKAFSRKRNQEIRTIFSKAFKNVAVFVLVFITIYGTAYAAFSEVRVQTLNFLIATSDVSTRLTSCPGARNREFRSPECWRCTRSALCWMSPRPCWIRAAAGK